MVLKIISHSAPFVYPQLSQKYDTLKSNKTAMIRVLKLPRTDFFRPLEPVTIAVLFNGKLRINF